MFFIYKMNRLLIILFVLLIIITLFRDCNKEGFAAGLDAIDAECINNCEEKCVANWPLYLRGPIGDGAYMCRRWCERNCSGCPTKKCYSQNQLSRWIQEEKSY